MAKKYVKTSRNFPYLIVKSGQHGALMGRKRGKGGEDVTKAALEKKGKGRHSLSLFPPSKY